MGKASHDGAIFLVLLIYVSEMERVNVYVDGFNFYYGLKIMKKMDNEWQKFYWLNYVSFFEQFIGENQILQKVIYFAAPPPVDADVKNRQKLLFNANKLLNPERFEVVMGKFYKKTLKCKVCKAKYYAYEEKQTDVNIAIRLVRDSFLDCVDTLVLVSADSDLVPPLKLIKELYPDKKIRVYFPPGNISIALEKFMKSNKKPVVWLENNKQRFSYSVMPDTITVGETSYTIPTKWQSHQPVSQ